MTLTERLQAQLAARAATDPRMCAILRRIQAGTASFSDTALYTRYLGEQLGGILADALPDAAPEEIAEAARVLLREAHADVIAQAAIVQEIQDRQLGASLAAKRPKYPAGRVEKVASSLTDQTVPIETRQRRARNASANVVASYHDEFIKENARIRSDAGFSCKTVRLGTQCCPWCAKLTGSYPAGSEPHDLFRRHDNCTCTIIYETRRTRQTLRGQGKSWNVVEEVERKAPTRFSRDEAKALQEAEMGRYRGLTNGQMRDMIEDKSTGIVLDTELYHGEVVHYAITDERMGHVAPLSIASMTDNENAVLTQACKDLLEYMKKDVLGREGALVFNMEMREIDRYKAEGATSSLPARTYGENCIVIHNHSSDTLLSDNDLLRFYEHSEYKILGAVGHNGSTYFVEKTKDYDEYGFWDFLEECKRGYHTEMSATERVKYVEQVMKGAGEYGVRFYSHIYP